MITEIQSFTNILKYLAKKGFCYEIFRGSFQCYAFNLDIANWWLAVYVKRNGEIKFRLFGDDLKIKNLNLKGLKFSKNENLMVFEFKGLNISIKIPKEILND